MAHLGYRTTNWTRIQNARPQRKAEETVPTRGDYHYQISLRNSRGEWKKFDIYVDSWQECCSWARNHSFIAGDKDANVFVDGESISRWQITCQVLLPSSQQVFSFQVHTSSQSPGLCSTTALQCLSLETKNKKIGFESQATNIQLR